MKNKIFIVIAVIILLFTSCKNSSQDIKSNEDIQNPPNDHKTIGTSENYNPNFKNMKIDEFLKSDKIDWWIRIPNNFFDSGDYKDKVIGFSSLDKKDDKKTLYSYDKNNGNQDIVATVLDSDNYFGEIYVKDNWLIWVENEDKVIGNLTDAHGFNWILNAKNLLTGEIITIDKAKYGREDFQPTYYYSPTCFSIDKDKLVYMLMDKKDDSDATVSRIFLYDFNSRNLQELMVCDKDVTKEAFVYPKIYDNKVVWLYRSGENALEYSDLFILDLNTKEKKQLTKDVYIGEIGICDNEIATIVVPKNEFTYEIYLYNINEGKWRKLLTKDMNFYEDLQIGKEMPTVQLWHLDINKDYIIAQDQIRGPVILDRKNEEWFCIEDSISLLTYSCDNKCIIIHHLDEELNEYSEYIKLK